MKQTLSVKIGSVFRTQSSIPDEIYFRKWLTAFSPELFPQISFIKDVRQGSKSASDYG